MRYYQSNPACRCGRCSTRSLMGPAVLVTLGLLFLAGNMSGYPFERTWPILLIVIGAVKVARYVIPDDGHFNPGEYPPPYAGPYPVAGQYPPPPQQVGAYATAGPNAAAVNGPVATPAPAPVAAPAAAPAAAPGEGKGGDDEVHNG